MANIILIEDDPRVISTIASLVSEVSDEHRLKVFRSYKEFSDLYFNPNRGSEPSAIAVIEAEGTVANDPSLTPELLQKTPLGVAPSDNEEQSLQLLSTIDLLILKFGLAPSKAQLGLDGLYTRLKKFGYFPPEGRTRLMLTKYEDDGISKVDLLKPYVDDIVFLPIDRLVFLQKTEILLALPKLATPSFLFSQETALNIEIAKLSQIKKISDWGCAISNPVPLVPGLLAHFYIDITGDPFATEAYAKVIHSEKENENSTTFLIYFSFLGLDRSLTLKLRKIISTKVKHFEPFKSNRREDCSFNPDHLFLSDEERNPRNIIVIDSDAESLVHTTELIHRELDLVQISSFVSYPNFLKQYFDVNNKPLSADNIELPESDQLLGNDFQLEFDLHNLKLLKPPLAAEGEIPLANSEMADSPASEPALIGFEFKNWKVDETEWLSFFGDGVNKETFDEKIEELRKGKKSTQTLFILKTPTGNLAGLFINLSRKGDAVLLKLNPCQFDELKAHLGRQTRLSSIDLLIIDSQFIPKTVESWITGLQELARKHGLLSSGREFSVIIMQSEFENRSYQDFADTRIRGLVKKPCEAKPLLTLIGLATRNPYSLYHFFNMNWLEVSLSVQVAREAMMVKLSEYGVSLKYPRPIQPGTFLFLRKSIFDNAPRKNLCARFYSCTEDPNEKGQYLCHLIYIGINDSFLKFARSWFRETYAISKGPGF